MTNETTQKMLERVRALIAKADSTEFEGEAEVFRAKADEIMTRYAIDQFMVDQAQSRVGAAAKPEIRYVDFTWWYSEKTDRASSLWTMFQSVASHCRCVIAVRGQGKNGESYHKMPIIGLSSDLDWCDMLFTSLMLQMVNNLEVKPDAAKSLAENIYAMRMAGMGWMRSTELLWNANLVGAPRGKAAVRREYDWYTRETTETKVTDETPWADVHEEARMAIKNRLAQVNRNYAREHGLERNYVKPEVYQRSYAMGFSAEVRDRLTEMARKSRAAYSADHAADSMALAIRDIKAQALDLYNEMFPPPAPVAVKAGRRSRAVATREVRVDHGAMSDGRKAGAKADIGNSPGSRIRSQRELS